MNNSLRLVSLILLIGISCFVANGQQFKNADEAIKALGNQQIRNAAIEFLVKNPKKSVPILKKIIKEKKENWVWAMSALNKTAKDVAVSFYIKLLKDNFYEKEKDGRRKLSGFGNIYGGALAGNLAWLGDKRAIPVLQTALKQGDYRVRERAFYALYKLKDISLQDLFNLTGGEKEVDIVEIIMSVGWENIHSNTKFAIEIFNKVIREFPNDKYHTASAHFWKIQCFEILKMYDEALRECEEVLKYTEFENLTKQVKKWKERLLLKS